MGLSRTYAEHKQGKYIWAETSEMHDKVTEIYEALSEGENKEALVFLEQLAEKVRNLKNDLNTKED